MARPKKQEIIDGRSDDANAEIMQRMSESKVYELIGGIKTLGHIKEMYAQLSEYAMLKKLDELINSGMYKKLSFPDLKTGIEFVPENKEEFCKRVLGIERRNLSDKLLSANVAGDEETYNWAKQLGFNRNDFKALAKLEDDTRQEVIVSEAFKRGDLDAVRDMIDGLSEKVDRYATQADKARVEAIQVGDKLKEAQRSIESRDRLLADKDRKINELDEKLHASENIPMDTWAKGVCESISEAFDNLIVGDADFLGIQMIQIKIGQVFSKKDCPQHVRDLVASQVYRAIAALVDIRDTYALMPPDDDGEVRIDTGDDEFDGFSPDDFDEIS